MATAEQLKALLESHLEGDDDRFFSVIVQLAAHAARQGHGRLAQELRELVDKAKLAGGTPPGRVHGHFDREPDLEILVRHVVDRDHGSSLTAWEAMGKPDFPLPHQQEQLRAAGHLPPSEVRHLQGENPRLELTLAPHALALVEIERQ